MEFTFEIEGDSDFVARLRNLAYHARYLTVAVKQIVKAKHVRCACAEFVVDSFYVQSVNSHWENSRDVFKTDVQLS